MPISSNEFRAALSKFASGVTVVTTKDAEGNLHGITVSAFCSLSLDPPLVLVCIEKTAGSHHAFTESGHFVVNILSEEQIGHSNQFASPIPDKFEGIEFVEGIKDVPVLKNALANLECSLVNSHENGDHTIFVGQIEKITLNDNDKPLLYFHGNYRMLKDFAN